MHAIKIIALGKIKTGYFKDGIENYLKWLKPYARIDIVELQSQGFGKTGRERAKLAESAKIEAALRDLPPENVFLLDEKGESINSAEFARLLGSQSGEIFFVIGGPLGFSEDIISSGYKKISLSRMTFPHELARLLLLEQIYRATTILNNKTYHY